MTKKDSNQLKEDEEGDPQGTSTGHDANGQHGDRQTLFAGTGLRFREQQRLWTQQAQTLPLPVPQLRAGSPEPSSRLGLVLTAYRGCSKNPLSELREAPQPRTAVQVPRPPSLVCKCVACICRNPIRPA